MTLERASVFAHKLCILTCSFPVINTALQDKLPHKASQRYEFVRLKINHKRYSHHEANVERLVERLRTTIVFSKPLKVIQN